MAVQLGVQPHDVARRERQAAAPPQRAGRQIEAVGAAAPFVPGEARHLDQLRRFLADDRVERDIRFPGADAGVLLSSRRLDEGADCEGRRVLAILRPQIHFRAHVEVADVVAGPLLGHARIAVDDAAEGGVVDEKQRPHVAVDARVDEEGSEQLGASA